MKNTQKPTHPQRQRREIYPVTQVSLYIVIVLTTVVIGAMLYNWAMVSHDHAKTPKAGFEISGNVTTNYTVTITDIDFTISLNDTEYYLKDAGGVAVPGVQGDVQDINGLNISDNNVNLSFTDQDLDGMLSSGDYFELVSQENGGLVKPGYSLRIAYGVSGDTICQAVFVQ